MPLLDLDPSLAVGLLCPSAVSFERMCTACAAISAKCLAPFSVTEAPPRIPPDLDERLSAGSAGGGEEDEEVCLL